MPCPISLGESCGSPSVLKEANYPAVRHCMLDAEGHQIDFPVATVDLTTDDAAAEGIRGGLIITRCFTSSYYGNEQRLDTSFAQQMHAVTENAPAVALTTYRSCLPVSNALLGFYDKLRGQVPQVDHVNVSWHHRPNGFDFAALERDEVARLEPIVKNRKVLIIDQYVDTASSLKLAAKIARLAGASSILGMAGNWYKNLFTKDESYPDPDDLSSLHSEFMFELGQEAATISPSTLKPMFDSESARERVRQIFE